jgi:DNA topoisomerase-1
VSQGQVTVREGRFGPYVTDGEVNASLRKGDDVETITLERAAELLADRRERAPVKKKAAKKTAAKKAPAKKAPAKKATATKSTATKSTATKSTATKRTAVEAEPTLADVVETVPAGS